MKKIILFLVCFFAINSVKSQIDESCITKEWIVAAENLNFRNLPNENSKVKGQLANSELLTLLEIHKERGEEGYCCSPWSYSSSWLKVKRNKTDEIGYVYGAYIKPRNIAYLNNQSCDRIQKGFWYGLFNENGKVRIKQVTPKLSGPEMDGYKELTVQSKECKLIIGSAQELKEGLIHGQLFSLPNEYIKIGTNRVVLHLGGKEYRLICSGEVKLNPPYEWVRKNEKLELLAVKDYENFQSQDLTNCVSGYGNIGYQIHFIGDLNRDGFPELILSEAGETEGGTLYYFMSDKNGKLKLESMTVSGTGC